MSGPSRPRIARKAEKVGAEAASGDLMVGDVAVGLAELGEAAIPSVGRRPNQRTSIFFGAVILTATQRLVRVSRMQANALELDSGKITIEIRPYWPRWII